jgi:hypothetical protein
MRSVLRMMAVGMAGSMSSGRRRREAGGEQELRLAVGVEERAEEQAEELGEVWVGEVDGVESLCAIGGRECRDAVEGGLGAFEEIVVHALESGERSMV